MVYDLNDITWGGSGIEKVVFDFIRDRIPEGSTVVELGAGLVSTKALSRFYNLYSVEHDEKFIGLVDGVNYIHAPLVDGWYDLNILKERLPAKYDMVLVDGVARQLLLYNMDLFMHSALYVVHDTNRDNERLAAIGLSKILKRKAEFYSQGDYWASI